MSVIVFGLFMSIDMHAQTTNPELTLQTDEVRPEAQLNDDYSIVLDVRRPVMPSYAIDVSHFSSSISDQQSADDFAEQFEKENVEVLISYPTLSATVNLNFDATNENWTVEEWNEYLKN